MKNNHELKSETNFGAASKNINYENDIILRGVQRQGKNSYKMTVYLGRDPRTGKAIRRTDTYRIPDNVTSKRERERLVREAYAEFELAVKEFPETNENMKFSDLVKHYISKYAETQLSPVTCEQIIGNLENHILPVFADQRVKDIQTNDITQFLVELELASETARKLKNVMSGVFTFGVEQKLIKHNPCKGALYRKEDRKDKSIKLPKGWMDKKRIGTIMKSNLICCKVCI